MMRERNPRPIRTEPSQKELFTGGKAAEFAVFFNVAFTKLLRTIHFWETGKTDQFDEEILDNKYGPRIDQFQTNTITNDFSDEIYSKLRNYIWKGYRTDRNSSGYELDVHDKRIIRQLILKLRALRNFHAHIYHDNQELTFQHDLKNFIMGLHDEALFVHMKEHPQEVVFYQENFVKHPLFDRENRITQEGRTFFLSLFLTTGEVSRLLQQRRGSKKNDELKYRIKHQIYRYYAHRDGATRKYYNLEEDLLDSLAPQEQIEILSAQKFYKLNSQINDIPPFIHDVDLFPLHFAKADGSYSPAETVQDLLVFCRQNNLLNAIHFAPIIKHKQEQAGAIEFRISGNEVCAFQIKKGTLHKIILDAIRSGEEAVLERLNFFIQERTTLLEALRTPAPETGLGTIGDTPVLLSDYEKYKLRGSPYLKEKFVGWLMHHENRHQKADSLKQDLIRKLETAPIEIRHFDLFWNEDQKPRTTDRFMEFCVTYLIDSKAVPNWYWAFERFETVQKNDAKTGKTKQVLTRVVSYNNDFPQDGAARLSIQNNHILVKLSNQREARPFAFGIKALENLMCTLISRYKKEHSENNAGKPTDFIQHLLSRLQSELNQMDTAIQNREVFDLEKLKLLEKSMLPEGLLARLGAPGTEQQAQDWKERTQKRIIHILEALQQLHTQKNTLSRAAKNEQIMRCYQLFEWDPKFLRQHEYQQISIFHYSLKQITALEKDEDEINRGPKHARHKVRSIQRKLDYYYDLLNAIKAENPNRIPQEINNLLQKATDLDDLFDRAIALSQNTLTEWLNIFHTGRNKARQSEIARRLKVNTPVDKRMQSYPAHIPFSIHPLLVLKAFNQGKTDLREISLSKLIRDNETLTRALRTENYDTAAYDAYLAPLPEPMRKKIQRKIIGERNSAITRDAILWFVAGWYFDKISPNVQMAITQVKGPQALPAKVGNLRRSLLQIPVGLHDGRKINVELFFHQLDDTLFVESKNMLDKVVQYIYRRKEESPEKYAEVRPDGLTYGEIVKEMARIQNEALIIARRLLEWEYNQIKPLPDTTLVQMAAGKKQIGFTQLCTHSALPDDQQSALQELRNHVFHLKTPVAFTYFSKVQDPVITALLGTIDLENKKDPSIWQKDV